MARASSMFLRTTPGELGAGGQPFTATPLLGAHGLAWGTPSRTWPCAQGLGSVRAVGLCCRPCDLRPRLVVRSVLYFSWHRYEHGRFWPYLPESDADAIGQGRGRGFTVNLPWNQVLPPQIPRPTALGLPRVVQGHPQSLGCRGADPTARPGRAQRRCSWPQVGMGNADYLAAFLHVLLPLAFEVTVRGLSRSQEGGGLMPRVPPTPPVQNEGGKGLSKGSPLHPPCSLTLSWC